MVLHKNFSKSPHAILDSKIRWFPVDEALREKRYEKLLPSLVYRLRKEVVNWRAKNYKGASDISRALFKYSLRS